MSDFRNQTVIDAKGVEGRIVALEPPSGGGPPQANIEFADGRRALVPQDLLSPQPDGTLRLPFSLAEIAGGQAGSPTLSREETRLPVVEERPVVRKQAVARTFRVTKRVQEREEVVDEPLFREQVEVTHVLVGAWVDGPVPVRQDGDTTILPLFEEVLVVEKRLRLVEEVHITKRRVEAHDPKTVTLRREEAVVEPVEGPTDGHSAAS